MRTTRGESPVDESHSGAVKGIGIGLSIVKATVQAHGGKITAKQLGDTITFGGGAVSGTLN